MLHTIFINNKNPAVIPSVGIDEKGELLINIFSKYGACIDFFQVDYDHETGKVYAEKNKNLFSSRLKKFANVPDQESFCSSVLHSDRIHNESRCTKYIPRNVPSPGSFFA